MSVVVQKEFSDSVEQDIESIASVALIAANDRLGAALVRIWAVRPGDICQSCEMAPMCPKRDVCLHLLAEQSTDITDPISPRIPLGVFKIGKAVVSGQPLVLSNFESLTSAHHQDLATKFGLQAYAAMPLIGDNETLGVLEVMSREPFSVESREDLEVMARRTAAALGTLLAKERNRRTMALQDILNELSTEVVSILELDRLLDRIAEIVKKVIDYNFFNVLILNKTKTGLLWKLSIGYDPVVVAEHSVLPIDYSIAGSAVRERRAVIVGDVARDERNFLVPHSNGEPPRSEIAIPLINHGRVLGVLTIESAHHNYFTIEHERVLTILANQIAIALENSLLYEELRRAALVKDLLYEVGKELSSTLVLDELLEKLPHLVKQVIDYDAFAIFRVDEITGDLLLEAGAGYAPQILKKHSRIPSGQGLIGRALTTKTGFIVSDVKSENQHVPIPTKSGLPLASQLTIPLLSKDQVVGVIAVESGQPNYFTNEDLQTMTTLGSQVATALENARLYAELFRREQRMETQMRFARDVQMSMMPDAPPKIPGFEIASFYLPATDLGGDYYDFLPLDRQNTAIILGDVSGKGASAALVMAASRSALRSAARSNRAPAEVFENTNRRIYRDIRSTMYITLFYGVLNAKTRKFTWSNAGHNPPILVKGNGQIVPLEVGGTVVGLFENPTFEQRETRLKIGDVICMYTDGVTEAHNSAREEFGDARLIEILKSNRTESAQTIIDKIVQAVSDFSEGSHQHDDITIVTFKYVGQPEIENI